jgi:hypothetical protein
LRTCGLHNVNTDDGLPLALHIVKRGRVYPYVRRVAPDLASAFHFSRAPRSLRASDQAAAYLAAARAHAEIETQFAKLRREKGFAVHAISAAERKWADWQTLAEPKRNRHGEPPSFASLNRMAADSKSPRSRLPRD